ncbi:MAG: hypothetical protein GX881_02315 [Firmicutes bacterium]|nr:hypothetical protein [Bacillota bacterium]
MVKKIKSALELAMEQTADLKNLPKEDPGLEDEPYLKAAALLAKSFLEQQSAPDKSAETIERYPGGAREKAARIFLETITAEMKPAHCRRVAAAYRRLDPGQVSAAVEAVEELGRKYEEEDREMQRRIDKEPLRTRFLEPLHRAGIGGTALEGVNPERSPLWRDQLKRPAKEYEPQLAALKEQLLAAIKK